MPRFSYRENGDESKFLPEAVGVLNKIMWNVEDHAWHVVVTISNDNNNNNKY